MEIIINKVTLTGALKKVSRAISSKSVVPSLTGILIATDEKGLVMTGSNSDLSIRVHIGSEEENQSEIEILDEGSIILPAKEFSGIARSMPGDSISIKTVDEFKVQVKSNKSKFVLNCMSGDDYPRLPVVDGEGFIMKGNELKSLTEKTIHAVSKVDTRPILTGVNVFFEDKTIGMVATDGHRLSKVTGHTISEGKIPNNGCTIPEKTLKELPSLIGDSKDVEITIKNNQIVFKTDETYILSRLLEGDFPDTERLIPKDYKTLLTVDRHTFLSSIERSAILSDKEASAVQFEITGGNGGIFETIELSHRSTELGQSKEEIIVDEIEGDELTISFNPNYMIETLKKVDEDKIMIEFNGAMRPFIIKPIKINNFTQLILPVRTY